MRQDSFTVVLIYCLLGWVEIFYSQETMYSSKTRGNDRYICWAMTWDLEPSWIHYCLLDNTEIAQKPKSSNSYGKRGPVVDRQHFERIFMRLKNDSNGKDWYYQNPTIPTLRYREVADLWKYAKRDWMTEEVVMMTRKASWLLRGWNVLPLLQGWVGIT